MSGALSPGGMRFTLSHAHDGRSSGHEEHYAAYVGTHGAARRLGLRLAVAFLFVAPLAQADADEATALFNRGLADMQAHRFDTGCPALERSYQQDPHPGGLITLAECNYQWGKLALAREEYASFLDLVAHMPRDEAKKQAERSTLAASRRTELDRDVPIVTLTAKGGAPEGTTLSLDGDAPTAPGTLRRVDPGHHVARLLTPDGRTATMELSVGKAENRIFVVGFDVVTPGATPAPSDLRKPWLITAVVVGATGLLAGAVLGAVAIADKSTVDAHCPSGGLCDSNSAVSTANTAVAVGWGSTAAFAVGLAGAGAAVGLWLTRPTHSGSGVAIIPLLVPPSPATRSYGSVGARLEF
jgi:hypothetical protein